MLSFLLNYGRHDFSYMSSVRSTEPDTPQSVTQNLRNLEISAPIRTKWQYNNIMFTVASYLIETLSGPHFSQFLHRNFLVPLGMNSTHLQPSATKAAGLADRMATQYTWHKSTQTYTPVEYQQCIEAQGAGSIFTSVNDYIKWVKAMMNQEAPITDAVYDGLTRPRIIECPDTDGEDLEPFSSHSLYCAGLEQCHYRGYRIMKHNGGIEGSGSWHFFLPGVKFAGVILGNADSAGDLGDIIAHELVDDVLGVPEEQKVDWIAWQCKLYDDDKEKDEEDKLQDDGSKLEDVDLSLYTGRYWNAGYHGMEVEIKDDKLFVDATDRTMGFTLTFEPREQGKFITIMSNYFEPGVDNQDLEAEFKLEDDKVNQMGIKLEKALVGLIWFDKVRD